MYWTTKLVVVAAIAVRFPSWVSGQQSQWQPNQVNTTMCAWRGLRAAQLKDTAYINGGFLYWVPGYEDGSYGAPISDDNPYGTVYTLNFSTPFNSSTNVTSILGPVAIGGAANNLLPNYYDGGMLANDYEFYLYGGLLRATHSYPDPDQDEVVSYQASDYGLVKDSFHPGFVNARLPTNVTRYVTYGGTANAPSENMAWYFGGYRSSTWGPIYQPSANANITYNPTNVSNTLITLDLSDPQSGNWTNSTLPDSVPSRADPSVVWVPVGEHGILVVLGGVFDPDYNNVNQTSINEAQSEKVSPGYMANIDIYDVANGTWYSQTTVGAPPQRAMGCAVLATAQDSSSHNIYYYGGFDGLHELDDFSDDVWVLSLPSFTWTKLYAGTAAHARAGHQCLTPYPDQMVTIGGGRALKGFGIDCLVGGILQVFNLTEGQWLDSYDPNVWGMYGVPTAIHNKIGGGYSGGATVTTPMPNGWDDQGLASVFATAYNSSKITHYYPYKYQAPANGTETPENSSRGGTPSWVAPVLGVVLGLVFVTAVVVGILLYRKRKFFFVNKNSGSDHSTDVHHGFIRSWLNSLGDKAVTDTTEHPSSRYEDASRNVTPMIPAGYSASSPTPEMGEMGEMPNNPAAHHPRYELDATNQGPSELADHQLPHEHVLRKYTMLHSPSSPHSGSPHSALKSPSFHTGSVSQEMPSSLSSSAAAMSMSRRGRADSPSLGTTSSPSPEPGRTPPPNRDTVVSGLSHISEHGLSRIGDSPSHARNLSDTTVSSTSNAGGADDNPSITMAMRHGAVSPPLPSPPLPSPPTLDDATASDYINAYQTMDPRYHGNSSAHAGPSRFPGTTSSLRASIFRESADDMGDEPHSRTG
ncbi:hypothetical protein GGR51DRAFT_339544 [Nemania sp. FL0031]|nr:hypothetical protein GGR51DRAFT_339544 [Nemania sp. FL0031]